jgi:hypothetical protein
LNEGSLTLNNSTISGNSASNGGGGILNEGSLTLNNSTISGNSASNGGGGIYDVGATYVDNSTISGNSSGGDGGGVYEAAILQLVNSTLSANRAAHNGGGIYIFSSGPERGTVGQYNATVAYNAADTGVTGFFSGGGVANSGGTFHAQNTILADNSGSTCITLICFRVPDDCNGTLDSGGYNLIGAPGGCSYGPDPTTLTGQDARLGALADNGGATLTHALLPGSPAIDAGSPLGCMDNTGMALLTDQRGWSRYVNGRCDIGAYEAPRWTYLPRILQ